HRALEACEVAELLGHLAMNGHVIRMQLAERLTGGIACAASRRLDHIVVRAEDDHGGDVLVREQEIREAARFWFADLVRAAVGAMRLIQMREVGGEVYAA